MFLSIFNLFPISSSCKSVSAAKDTRGHKKLRKNKWTNPEALLTCPYFLPLKKSCSINSGFRHHQVVNTTSTQGIIKLQISTYTLLYTREPNHTSYKRVQTFLLSLLIGGKKAQLLQVIFCQVYCLLRESSYISWLLVSPVPLLFQYPTKLQFHCNPEVTQEHSICTQQMC